MCGGFTCSKNALTALNILYILVAFILIFAATIGKISAYVTSETVIGGIVACGVFLLLVSVLGLIGAMKHHQVMLFFYMVILFLLFIVQFSVAIACLAVTNEQRVELLRNTWDRASNETQDSIQHMFQCCSFDSLSANHPSCGTIPACCPDFDPAKNVTCCTSFKDCSCKTCRETLLPNLSYVYKVSGILGLVFSFTEFVGVWLTMRYRNQKDPRASAAAFL